MAFLKNKFFLFTLILVLWSISGCSSQKFSTRDITPDETSYLTAQSSLRTPANWVNSCFEDLKSIFKETKAIQVTQLPELALLNPETKKFPNGKKYIQYTANINAMKNYPEYDTFLKTTAEIIFEPADPFGHIRLRIGEKTYSFNFIKSTSINQFTPVMKNSNISDMPSSTGFVFSVEKQKIEMLESEIEAFYNSSASNNVPPFDAYSPLLKIVEFGDGAEKKLKFETTSPKYGNDKELKGKIVQEGKLYFIDTEDGIKLPLIKKGNDFYLQSYSCSSSAQYILQHFFDIDLTYANSAKSLNQSLLKGNINGSISPVAIIKYYEN
ncbi:MAG: hypothetical protein Q7U04_09420 [Bacteriovorax sp.]|nr:hypothetical protein [Bacteriovorax sp.]